MEITNVEIVPLRSPEKGLQGFASITLDNEITLNSLGIYTKLQDTENGLFRTTKPARKLASGSYKFYFTLSPELDKKICKAIEQKIKKLGLWSFKTE